MRGFLRTIKQTQSYFGFDAAAVRCFSSSTTQHGGWKVPTAANTNSNNPKHALEYVSITHPRTKQSVQIALQQRFTMAPGQQTAASHAATGDQTGTWVWPTTHVLLDHFLKHNNTNNHLSSQLCRHPTKEEDQVSNNKYNNNNKQKFHILELGAGCGLLGMALAAIDSKLRVTLTDHSGNIKWLRQNLDQNRSLLQDRVIAKPLSWGDVDDCATVLNEDVNVILGSDLIYEASRHSALVDTLVQLTQQQQLQQQQQQQRHVNKSQPIVIYLAYPHRDQATEDNFVHLLQQHSKLFGTIEKQILDKNVHLATIVCNSEHQ